MSKQLALGELRQKRSLVMDDNQVEDMISCGIDYRGGIDRFGGNTVLYEKFIFRYLDDDHFNQLVRAIDAGDSEEGFRVAHTLKGVVGNLSFSEFFTVLDPATEALRDGEIEKARTVLPAIEKAHNDVVAVLKKYQ